MSLPANFVKTTATPRRIVWMKAGRWYWVVILSAVFGCSQEGGTVVGASGMGGGAGSGGTSGHESGGRGGDGGMAETGGHSGTSGSAGIGEGGDSIVGGSGGSGVGGMASTGGRGGDGGMAETGGHSGTSGSPGIGEGGDSIVGGSGEGGDSSGDGGASSNAGASGAGGALACGTGSLAYDQVILCDTPVVYLAMDRLSGNEPDLTGNGHNGSYEGGTTNSATLPNGDIAADFNGSDQSLTIPSSPAFSISTTGDLTWEAWVRPDVLQFPNASDGYVNWLGKCASYSPTCEWQARMYATTNPEDRCNRFSAYVFNATAGLGSGAYWQASCGSVQEGQWYHVVGEYTIKAQPEDCPNAQSYPGSIEIWVNGVKWSHASHGETGCLSQYQVVPTANGSPVNVATVAKDNWFPGAIGKVAIYDSLLSQAQVSAHFTAMTGNTPSGSCAAMCSF